MYALGRLAYFILTGGEHRPVDPATPTQLARDNLSKMLPQLHQLEAHMPGAADLLMAWLVDRQPVAESLQQQHLLLAAKQSDLSALTGWPKKKNERKGNKRRRKEREKKRRRERKYIVNQKKGSVEAQWV